MSVSAALKRIDTQWLDAALRTGGHAGARVRSARSEPLTFTGATTDMARIRIAYAEDGTPGPGSLIAKIRGRDELRVRMDAVMGLFAREARFYQELVDRIGLRVPHAYAIGDGDTHPLLLEDLGDLRMGDQSKGLTVPDAQRCMDALADMHATFWDWPGLGGEWLARPNLAPLTTMVAQLMTTGAAALTDRYAGKVPDRVLEQVPMDARGWERILRRMGEGPHTLVNNDCRLDNLFFAEEGTPVFIDWQLLADARGTQDIGNLLAGSMEPEDLSAHWESLLRRYHDRLLAHGIRGYGFDECTHHYRQSVVWALGQGMSLIGAVGAGDERGVGDRIVLRSLSHIAELDSFAALAQP